MSEATLKKAPYETLFAKTYPLQRRFGCKGTTKFADMQILSEKSFRSFKSSKGNRAISVKRTAQCTYCLGFRDDTKITIYVRWDHKW